MLSPESSSFPVRSPAQRPLLCELFCRYRNLYPLAIAHGLVGLVLAAAIPDLIHHQMKVGMAYFTGCNRLRRTVQREVRARRRR